MLQEGTSLLLLEEPELSLNSEIVRQLPAIFAKAARKSRRQLIISTHSQEMLADKSVAPEETIMLTPGKEGTLAQLCSKDKISYEMYKSGLSMAEAAFPNAAPKNPEQLCLNFDL